MSIHTAIHLADVHRIAIGLGKNMLGNMPRCVFSVFAAVCDEELHGRLIVLPSLCSKAFLCHLVIALIVAHLFYVCASSN